MPYYKFSITVKVAVSQKMSDVQKLNHSIWNEQKGHSAMQHVSHVIDFTTLMQVCHEVALWIAKALDRKLACVNV